MIVAIDTREQLSYEALLQKMGCECKIKTLPIGDYAIEGVEGFALERKSLNDLIGSITRDRDRFRRELEKAVKYDYFAVILECSLYDIQNRNYFANVHPNSILGTIASWSIKYGIPFIFAESRTGGALMVDRLCKQYYRHKVKK